MPRDCEPQSRLKLEAQSDAEEGSLDNSNIADTAPAHVETTLEINVLKETILHRVLVADIVYVRLVHLNHHEVRIDKGVVIKKYETIS